ncbi:hypothetical protein BVG16_27690 [Paenibacillus selenitireducens]|uniref:Uncharacterized protein n=1 Tax=Paenibacillus selenitireducens TaxID=1324314 RepID=A0A1T2X1J4_9BACL|nr:hypothetical protein [Paenibacillus selenitireducens]OPA73596.1 hypothetical protein BVG16_27690 [Paenibacillus selenitireducens]
MKSWTTTILPDPTRLKERMQILSALDAILCEEEWLRVHHYEQSWQPGVDLGVVKNGAGDHFYVIFMKEGVLIKGFDHESPLSPHAREDGEIWPGMYDEVPEALLTRLQNISESLEADDVTFCLWHMVNDPSWRSGEMLGLDEVDESDRDGGADFLFGYLAESSASYAEWAEDYFDLSIPLPLDVVSQIYHGNQVEKGWITALNPMREVQEVLMDLKKIGIDDSRPI